MRLGGPRRNRDVLRMRLGGPRRNRQTPSHRRPLAVGPGICAATSRPSSNPVPLSASRCSTAMRGRVIHRLEVTVLADALAEMPVPAIGICHGDRYFVAVTAWMMTV